MAWRCWHRQRQCARAAAVDSKAGHYVRRRAPDADLRAEKIVIDGLSTRFEVVRKGVCSGAVTIPTPGVHVAMNSLAAIAVALELGNQLSRSRRLRSRNFPASAAASKSRARPPGAS